MIIGNGNSFRDMLMNSPGTCPNCNASLTFGEAADTLKSTLKWISQQTGSEGGYARPTYEEIRDKFGCDAAKTHPDSWESDYHVYRWETSGGADFLVLSFKVAADGTETWNSSSLSPALKD